jgi:hypothetical protein
MALSLVRWRVAVRIGRPLAAPARCRSAFVFVFATGVTVNDQNELSQFIAIESLWILGEQRGDRYAVLCSRKGDGPEHGPDWQDRCLVWFLSEQEAAAQAAVERRIGLIPRQMGNQWRENLRRVLDDGVPCIVGWSHSKNGKPTRTPYCSIRDWLEGRLPEGLICTSEKVRPQAHDGQNRCSARMP